MGLKCKCGKGYASSYDGLCCFCRESLVRRADARAVGVRHRGDGLSIEQFEKIKAYHSPPPEEWKGTWGGNWNGN